jgi:hypothetical protein
MQTDDRPAPASLEQPNSPEPLRCGLSELPPPDLSDPVLELYKQAVDRTLLIKNLSLSPAQRAEKLVSFTAFLSEMRRARQRLGRKSE